LATCFGNFLGNLTYISPILGQGDLWKYVLVRFRWCILCAWRDFFQVHWMSGWLWRKCVELCHAT